MHTFGDMNPYAYKTTDFGKLVADDIVGSMGVIAGTIQRFAGGFQVPSPGGRIEGCSVFGQ